MSTQSIQQMNVWASRIEKASRLPVLVPLLGLAVARIFRSECSCNQIFSPKTLHWAKRGWTVRRGINAARIIPNAFRVIPILATKENFNRDKLYGTIEDASGLLSHCGGAILFTTGTALGSARKAIGNTALGLWVMESSMNLAKQRKGNADTLRSACNWLFCLSALGEVKPHWLKAAFGCRPFCSGLFGQGFGLLFLTSGIAASVARLAT